MTTAQQQRVPQNWPGSLPEWLVFNSLERHGLTHGTDFYYQSALMGGRLDKGGLVIDFTFSNPPDLAMNIQGVYYHYQFGVEVRARDRMAREQLAGQGTTLIFLDEDDVLRDVDFYVEEALQYRDHSRMARGLS